MHPSPHFWLPTSTPLALNKINRPLKKKPTKNNKKTNPNVNLEEMKKLPSPIRLVENNSSLVPMKGYQVILSWTLLGSGGQGSKRCWTCQISQQVVMPCLHLGANNSVPNFLPLPCSVEGRGTASGVEGSRQPHWKYFSHYTMISGQIGFADFYAKAWVHCVYCVIRKRFDIFTQTLHSCFEGSFWSLALAFISVSLIQLD